MKIQTLHNTALDILLTLLNYPTDVLERFFCYKYLKASHLFYSGYRAHVYHDRWKHVTVLISDSGPTANTDVCCVIRPVTKLLTGRTHTPDYLPICLFRNYRIRWCTPQFVDCVFENYVNGNFVKKHFPFILLNVITYFYITEK